MIDDVKSVKRWRAGGRGSASGFNAVRGAVVDLQQSMIHGTNGAGGISNRPPFSARGYRLAYIVSSAAQAGQGARWTYTCQFCSFVDNQTLQNSPGDTVTAINGVEFAHTAEPAAAVPWYVWGSDAHQDNVTLTPRAVASGTMIQLFKTYAANGSNVWYFFGIGGFDSECT